MANNANSGPHLCGASYSVGYANAARVTRIHYYFCLRSASQSMTFTLMLRKLSLLWNCRRDIRATGGNTFVANLSS